MVEDTVTGGVRGENGCGGDAFYTGTLAERSVAYLRSRRSALTADDLATFACEVVEPITDPLGDGLGSLMRVFHRANVLRGEHVADPRFADVDIASLVLIQSVYHAFGSGLIDPDTGVLFHNRGTSFALDAASPTSSPRASDRCTP